MPDNKPRFAPTESVVHRTQKNSPLMTVVRVVRSEVATNHKKSILGIECCWFDDNGCYQKELFHSKSLRHATTQELAHLQVQPALATTL